jgi:hypothetical protein
VAFGTGNTDFTLPFSVSSASSMPKALSIADAAPPDEQKKKQARFATGLPKKMILWRIGEKLVFRK